MSDPKNLGIASNTVHAVQSQRIFDQGLNANESKIGNYSKKPAYFSPSQSPVNFPGKGKDGKSKFKNGKPKKSRYFPNGYSGFRQAAGRQNQFVDLRLSGELAADYIVVPSGHDWVSGFQSSKSAAKAEGNEDRFGASIFTLSNTEIDVFLDVFLSIIDKNIK